MKLSKKERGEYDRLRRLAFPERFKEWRRKWCRTDAGIRYNRESAARYRSRNVDLCRLRTRNCERKRRSQFRVLVFNHYGRKCKTCGFSDVRALTIDHVNNNGADHRREGGGSYIYRWLVQNKFPTDGFEVMCANCQMIKHHPNRM